MTTTTTHGIDPDAQCPQHGCARWRCDEDHHHNYLVAGKGDAGCWSDHASQLDASDRDLWKQAIEAGLVDRLHAVGGATRIAVDGTFSILGDAWISMAHVDDESDLDSDPAVVAYCQVGGAS